MRGLKTFGNELDRWFRFQLRTYGVEFLEELHHCLVEPLEEFFVRIAPIPHVENVAGRA